MLSDTNGDFFECIIPDAEVLSEEGFCFTVSTDSNATCFELEVNGFCDIKINGKCSIKSSVTLFDGTKLSGDLHEIIFLGNLIQKEVPKAEAYNEFSVGFKKQAINIIANVLEARDYLYLWIYAHHKVIYYANFLIPVIASQIESNINPDLFPQWHLSYANIMLLDDAYIWTAVKCIQWKDNELSHLCDGLMSRSYKYSLYKSLAEYDLLFESFTVDQRVAIKTYLGEHCREDRPSLLVEGIVSAGYLNDEFLDQLKEFGADDIISLVFVDASYRSKKNNPHDTLIVMGDEIVSIDQIPLLARNFAEPEKTEQYVYFYFESNDANHKSTKELSDTLKSALEKLFQKKVIPSIAEMA